MTNIIENFDRDIKKIYKGIPEGFPLLILRNDLALREIFLHFFQEMIQMLLPLRLQREDHIGSRNAGVR